MLEVGPLAFAQPWLLLALGALPLLWWLLRLTPPSPRRIDFPALRLLTGLRPPEETPARTPPWLVVLRLLIATLIILGLAQPLLNPSRPRAGSGPLVLVVDDGWAAARNWPQRRDTVSGLIDQAERESLSYEQLADATDASRCCGLCGPYLREACSTGQTVFHHVIASAATT